MVKVVAKTVTKAEVRARLSEMTIYSVDDRGRQSEFTISFKDILKLASQAQTAAMALAQHGGSVNADLGFQQLPMTDPLKIEALPLAMESTPHLALVFDRGTQRQVAYRLSTETAEGLKIELGKALEAAKQELRTSRRDQ